MSRARTLAATRRKVTVGLRQMILVMATVASAVGGSSCSSVTNASSGPHPNGKYVSRPARNGHVLLVPTLRGGSAGWCMATAAEGTAGCAEPRTSTGPIVAEDGCDRAEGETNLYALTTSSVAAVSVEGGHPIPTRADPALPSGLRSVVVELLGRKGQAHPGLRLACPHMIPLDAKAEPIQQLAKPAMPLDLKLPGTLRWERPAHPPTGACRLSAEHLPPEIAARWGSIATRIRPYPGLIGRAFLSCVDTVYFYLGEHALDSAVLLDAVHPGATPPPLPGMKPVAGHSEIFQASGSEGKLVARRIPGAWLVVEETDNIGPRVPMSLLEHLRASGRAAT